MYHQPVISEVSGKGRSVRGVMSALLEKNGSQLDDEALRTFLCEVEAIITSRPLTVDNLNDPDSLNLLTPNHLLTMKFKVILPPPGIFQSPGVLTIYIKSSG